MKLNLRNPFLAAVLAACALSSCVTSTTTMPDGTKIVVTGPDAPSVTAISSAASAIAISGLTVRYQK